MHTFTDEQKKKFAGLGAVLRDIFDSHSEYVSHDDESHFEEEGLLLSEDRAVLGTVGEMLKKIDMARESDVCYFFAVRHFDRYERNDSYHADLAKYGRFVKGYRNLYSMLFVIRLRNGKKLSEDEILSALRNQNLSCERKYTKVYASRTWLRKHLEDTKDDIRMEYERINDFYYIVLADEHLEPEAGKCFTFWMELAFQSVQSVCSSDYTWNRLARKKRNDSMYEEYKALFKRGYTPKTLTDRPYTTCRRHYLRYLREMGMEV